MAAIVQFSIRVAKTINLGDFNSLKVEAGLTIERDPSIDVWEEDKARAQTELAALIEETYKAQRKRREASE